MKKSERIKIIETKRNLQRMIAAIDAKDKSNDKEIEKLLKHINYIDELIENGKQPKK